MKHFVKPSTGVSEGYIKFSCYNKRKIRNGVILALTGLIGGGVGQGGGASPIIWMAIFNCITTSIQKDSKGCNNSGLYQEYCYPFMDNKLRG